MKLNDDLDKLYYNSIEFNMSVRDKHSLDAGDYASVCLDITKDNGNFIQLIRFGKDRADAISCLKKFICDKIDSLNESKQYNQ